MISRKFMAIAAAVTGASAAIAQNLKVEIVNDVPGLSSDKVWVLVTGASGTVSGVTLGTAKQLSAITDLQINSLSAGRIYISFDNAVTDAELNDCPTRYDKVELTYPGAVNLTAVDFFSIPFRVETLDANGTVLQTLNYYASGDTLRKELAKVAPDAVYPAGELGDKFLRVLSPVKSPDSYPSMASYVASMSGQTVTIAGTYVGFVAPSPNTYSYTGTFGADGSITLSGTMSATPSPFPIVIAGSSLAEAIYTNNGSYTWNNTPHQVSDNDVYAAIYANFIGAFDFGYMGGKYGSTSAGWYGTTPYRPPYAAARTGKDGFYNSYASVVAALSDAYGFPFSDLNQPVQASLNDGGTGPVATLRITILPDDALDAPVLVKADATANSIDLQWNKVEGATDYEVEVSPPLGAAAVSVGDVTAHKLTGLSPGTPYTISVVAKNATKTSAAMPVVVSTTGQPTPIVGPVNWNFIPNFTGTFTNHTITFNGVSKTLSGTNTAIQFNNILGEPGARNAYVFKWTDASGALVFESILYVMLDAEPASGPGSIDTDATQTFMVANQHLPTWQVGSPFNLFLSIQPFAQRTVGGSTSSGGDSSPARFGPPRSVKAKLVNGGRKVALAGRVSDGDGLRRVRVQTTKGGQRELWRATARKGQWQAKVRHPGRRAFRIVVIAEDLLGNTSSKSYRIRL